LNRPSLYRPSSSALRLNFMKIPNIPQAGGILKDHSGYAAEEIDVPIARYSSSEALV